ncbi:Serine/threonine-protein phosphatase 4 regulatory subunit 4 [Collichthys lucidus]|uniref:Serine/threonine-protein phosphatase 4 regulatory subunit 4 n=1 Tax=Collichthys lucidus TaxID=240159 RepID=A0A4U5TWC1_COLLU|nr:Serine/threonine-protein phosphatase 4 regulatory subunit 4 [Collichthys lucidus]
MNQSSLLFGPLEELQELAFIERPIRRSLKNMFVVSCQTAEEIDQLTVDEDLNDIERAVYLLSVGQEVQRASVISNLPSLVRQNPAETFRRVVPKVRARLASCRILGKVACKFDSHIMKKELLPLVRSLCQDVEFEVRACMCRQLESIARATGMDDTRTELLPELVELAEDEESSVRLAAFDTIINLMEMMDSDDRLHVVVPLVMSVCEVSSQVDEAVMASLSFQFGKLCNGLTGSLSEEQKARLLQRFKVLCVAGLQNEGNSTDGNNESTLIRCNCCYNLPAMVVFSDPSHFLSELYPSFYSLCCDPEVSVRRSAAASFHQVVKLLGSNVQLVHKELLALLQDDALEVLDALMNHLEETLEAVLNRGQNLMLDNKFPELLSVLLLAEQKVGCSLRWRLHEKLLQRYSCLARLLPGELLHQNFSPRIFIILTTNKVLPVQKEAARTFCTFLRYNRKQEQRQEMMERLIQDLAQGRSYWNRLRFLDVCEMATEIFSRKYFNKHFLIPALELVHDPVANVQAVSVVAQTAVITALPADKQLLQQLDFCVQKLLCREKDKDVVATIRKTVLELDKLDLTEPEQLERQQTDGKLNSEKHTERKHDSLRTAHFTMASQSSSSMPVLIRSNTTSLLDRASTLDHRSGSMDHRTSTLEQRDHRTITLEQEPVQWTTEPVPWTIERLQLTRETIEPVPWTIERLQLTRETIEPVPWTIERLQLTRETIEPVPWTIE